MSFALGSLADGSAVFERRPLLCLEGVTGILHQFDAHCTTPIACSENNRIGLTVRGADPAAMTASQIWGGNVLAGRLCRRWLTLFTSSRGDSGQARSPGSAGGLLTRGYRAGTRPAPTVVTRGFEHRSLSQRFQLSTTVGHTMGGVAGGVPPHKGGPKARPHRTAVVSDQGRRHLRCSGTRIGFRLVVSRGVGKFTPNLDRPVPIGVLTRALCYATVPPNHIAERFVPDRIAISEQRTRPLLRIGPSVACTLPVQADRIRTLTFPFFS